MKRALIITYYWPPGSGPGVQRWLKFCKFLPEFGWEPTVITVQNGSYPSTDSSLEEDVPKDLEVIKTNTFEPFRLYNLLRGKSGNQVEVGMGNLQGNASLLNRFSNYIRANFFIPDARLGWNRYSVAAAIQSIRKARPDVIITTGPPHSTHLVGARLQKAYGIPWVADFRDPWTSIYYNETLNRTESSKAKDLALETSVLKRADMVVSATPGLLPEFESRAKNLVFIPNGYDQHDFDDVATNSPTKFRISYIGNFKSNQQVPTFWKVLSELINESEASIEINLVGNIHPAVQDQITKNGLEKHCIISEFKPHRQAVKEMMESHLLLLPIPESAGNKHILTGKLFEYLATQRPVLCIGPTDGEAAKVLKACDRDNAVDYNDAEGIKALLEKWIARFESDGALFTIQNDHHLQYSRKGLAETLANHLNKLIES